MSEQPIEFNVEARAALNDALRTFTDIGEFYAMIPEPVVFSGNPAAVAVYGTLDRMARKNGEVTAPAKLVAERSHLSEPTVKKALAFLRDMGALRLVDGGGSRPYRYVLAFRTARVKKFTASGKESLPQSDPSDKETLPLQAPLLKSQEDIKEPSPNSQEELQRPRRKRTRKPAVREPAPREFIEFDRILTEAFGSVYIPTAAFWSTIFSEYRTLPLNTEAVKMVDYEHGHGQWHGTVRTILAWLERAKVTYEQQTTEGGNHRRTDRARTGPYDRDFLGRTRAERAATEGRGE